MPKNSSERVELWQGTLDVLILRTLLFVAAHGHRIANHIQRTGDEALQVDHGFLHPALHRLERKAWVAAKLEPGKDQKRQFKSCNYRLTAAAKRQLLAEKSKWRQLSAAIAQIMWPAVES